MILMFSNEKVLAQEGKEKQETEHHELPSKNKTVPWSPRTYLRNDITIKVEVQRPADSKFN